MSETKDVKEFIKQLVEEVDKLQNEYNDLTLETNKLKHAYIGLMEKTVSIGDKLRAKKDTLSRVQIQILINEVQQNKISEKD
jgi:hypothetical protein